MCGIAGGFAFKTEGKVYLQKIEKALSCINHRGPDGDGIFQRQGIALGHKRLSIIDTSEAANQPMFSGDKRYCIIFNGEILNFKELIDLHFRDHQFSTSSDTEVFLELFIKKGADCFKDLRGFFAAAIYDALKDELYLVRDRFGKKPMHIFQNDNVILFASELRSLIAFGIPKEINKEVLSYYFQLNYIPQPYSILKGVEKLMPGCYLRITKNSVEKKIYYRLKIRKETYQAHNYEEAQKKLILLLDEATKMRLIADVPLGSFLSGGIDSSVVVALASKHKQRLNTFSIGYKDHPFFDETYYANLVAKKYNTNHSVFSLSNNDFLEHIDQILDSIDEPFADSSAIPTYILCKETRKHVTVALSGDGGDEVFAGYNKHAAEWKMRKGGFRHYLVKTGDSLWSTLPQSRNNKLTNKVRQLHRYATGAKLNSADRYWRWASIQSQEESLNLLHQNTRAQINPLVFKNMKEQYVSFIKGEDFNEVLLADMNLVLLSDMLVKVDMMSMANSLEVRSPFLDQEVVDFAFGMTSAHKIDASMKKKIVQDSFRKMLPEEIYNRPKKGFEIPMLDWLRKELWGLINDDLLENRFVEDQNLFDLSSIQNLKNKLHSSNPGDSHATIWALIVFQHWWKRNIKE